MFVAKFLVLFKRVFAFPSLRVLLQFPLCLCGYFFEHGRLTTEYTEYTEYKGTHGITQYIQNTWREDQISNKEFRMMKLGITLANYKSL